MVSPLKQVIPQFKEIEQNLWEIIAKKYRLPQHLPEEVKAADAKMLKTEKRDLLPETEPWDFLEGVEVSKWVITAWEINYAKWKFIHRFNELVSESKI